MSYSKSGAKRCILIVGCTNSGTTLLQNLLAQHPEVTVLPREGRIYTNAIGIGKFTLEKARLWSLEAQPLPKNKLAVEGMRLWWNKAIEPQKRIMVVKSPADLMRVTWWYRVFPDMRFIVMVRHGLAVAEGIFRRCQRYRRCRCDIESAARQWVESSKEVLALSGHPAVRIMCYENLCADPTSAVNRAIDGLDMEPMEIDKGERIQVHDYRLPVLNMNKRSIERIPPKKLKALMGIQRPMLEKLGYS